MKDKTPNYSTLVISLTSATRRRKLITDMFAESNSTDWNFFDALRHDAIVNGLESDLKRQTIRFGRPLTDAEIGCFKSHYSALLKFQNESENDWLLILEDDVWIDPDFDIKSTIEIAESKNISYMRLFAKHHKPAKIISISSDFRQLIRYQTDPYGAQAYLINKAGISRFIDTIKSIERPYDDELGRFWKHDLYPYCIFPFPAVERSVASSINEGRNEGNKSRSHTLPALILHRVHEKVLKWLSNLKQSARGL